jgi:hypothetical protein
MVDTSTSHIGSAGAAARDSCSPPVIPLPKQADHYVIRGTYIQIERLQYIPKVKSQGGIETSTQDPIVA